MTAFTSETVVMSQELFAAIEQHALDRISTLLAHGANPNHMQQAQPHWRPLHAAIEELEHSGPLGVLILLLRHGADVNAWDGTGASTPLLMALFRGQREAVHLLLAGGADPNVIGCEGDSPLRWVVEQGDHSMAELLLLCGAAATIDLAGGASGMTALGRAASRLDVVMMRKLLLAGAAPRASDADHRLACERLPSRDTDPELWDEAIALLTGTVPAG